MNFKHQSSQSESIGDGEGQLNKHHSYDSYYVRIQNTFSPLNAELNPICHLLALLGTHHIFHVSWIMVKSFLLFNP